VRAKSSCFAAVLALKADDCAENYGEQQANGETDERSRFGIPAASSSTMKLMPLSISRNFDPVGQNCFISSLAHCFARSNDARLLLKRSQLIHFYNEPISLFARKLVPFQSPYKRNGTFIIYSRVFGSWRPRIC
jgi:hypothetical protein